MSKKKEAVKKVLRAVIPWYLDKRFHKATPHVVCLLMVANVMNIALSYVGFWQDYFPNIHELERSSQVFDQALYYFLLPFQRSNYRIMITLSGVAIMTQLLVLVGKMRQMPRLYYPYLISTSIQFVLLTVFGMCLLWHSLYMTSNIVDSELQGDDKEVIGFLSYMGILFMTLLTCILGGLLFVLAVVGVNRSRLFLQSKTKVSLLS